MALCRLPSDSTGRAPGERSVRISRIGGCPKKRLHSRLNWLALSYPGVTHTVEVTAATLYPAVAQGLAALRGNEWVACIAAGLNAAKVSVADVRVEHAGQDGRFQEVAGKPRRLAA